MAESNAQEIYDGMLADKAKLAELRENRRADLLANPAYARTDSEIKEKREANKKIELDWTERNRDTVSEIDRLKERLDLANVQLLAFALNAAKTDRNLELYKNSGGEHAKVDVQFKLKLTARQSKLF